MSFGFFELYEMPRYPVPFPQNLLGIYSSSEELIRDFHFTKSEVDALLDGEVVREKYFMELLPNIMQDLMREDLLNSYNKPTLSVTEISYELDMSYWAVKKLIYRFRQSHKNNLDLQAILYELAERKKTRDCTIELKNTVKTMSH